MLIYDIMCQYWIRLANRVGDSPYLTLPQIQLEKAIGLFHVHGHKQACLFRYATTFIPGAAMVDGEILETNWGVLNRISKSVRTATLAHRAEVLDDHMNDHNWKKLIGIGMSMLRLVSELYLNPGHSVETVKNKYLRVVENLNDSQEYYEDLTKAPTAAQITLWEKQIVDAETKRSRDPSAMDIMEPKVPKRRSGSKHVSNHHSYWV